MSEGWVAWVGTYDDLKNGKEGYCRIKLAHTYLDKQNEIQLAANGDTGYCGNVVFEDGTIVTTTYGAFGQKKKDGKYQTYVVSKRIKLEDIDKLIACFPSLALLLHQFFCRLFHNLTDK